MSMTKCSKCSSENIDRGDLWSAGDTAYKSDIQKVVFNPNSKAYLCLDCGYVEFYVNQDNLDKLKKLIAERRH